MRSFCVAMILCMCLLFGPIFAGHMLQQDSNDLTTLAKIQCSKIGGNTVKQRDVSLFDCYKDDQAIEVFGRKELLKMNSKIVEAKGLWT